MPCLLPIPPHRMPCGRSYRNEQETLARLEMNNEKHKNGPSSFNVENEKHMNGGLHVVFYSRKPKQPLRVIGVKRSWSSGGGGGGLVCVCVCVEVCGHLVGSSHCLRSAASSAAIDLITVQNSSQSMLPSPSWSACPVHISRHLPTHFFPTLSPLSPLVASVLAIFPLRSALGPWCSSQAGARRQGEQAQAQAILAPRAPPRPTSPPNHLSCPIVSHLITLLHSHPLQQTACKPHATAAAH
jgi:hypothetical protein